MLDKDEIKVCDYCGIPLIWTFYIKYIPVSRYAELKGITEWYVNKLCRTGKVDCVKVGQMWFIHV